MSGHCFTEGDVGRLTVDNRTSLYMIKRKQQNLFLRGLVPMKQLGMIKRENFFIKELSRYLQINYKADAGIKGLFYEWTGSVKPLH